MPSGGAGGATPGLLEARRLARFLGDRLAVALLPARFFVDFLAVLRFAVFFFGDRVPVFFAAVRFLVAISSGSFRLSAHVNSLVYPLGAEMGGETSTVRKTNSAQDGRFPSQMAMPRFCVNSVLTRCSQRALNQVSAGRVKTNRGKLRVIVATDKKGAMATTIADFGLRIADFRPRSD
jgi:hypothetical protein